MKQFFAAVAMALSAGLAYAGVVYDNGSPTGPTSQCISGPSVCQGSGTWSIYDQFTLASANTVSGFAVWNYASPSGNYAGTNWSIWTSAPTNGGVALYSGSSIATLSTDQAYQVTTVDGLSINLAAGTYWLGINHTVYNSVWAYAYSSAATADAIQMDGDTFRFPNQLGLAFTISAVPEPETYAMLLAGLALVGAIARHRKQG